ncbi:MAG TPA: amphi-Trp domain-containing protein [Proteobacteria bacterium]|nr:amphi-Trp domain-containing protein [Pseudomonadota bacterium]
MEKKKLSLKKFMAPAEAAAKLEDLAAAFRSGMVRIEKDDQVLSLQLSDPVEIEISAREKKDKAVFLLNCHGFVEAWNRILIFLSERASCFRPTKKSRKIQLRAMMPANA